MSSHHVKSKSKQGLKSQETLWNPMRFAIFAACPVVASAVVFHWVRLHEEPHIASTTNRQLVVNSQRSPQALQVLRELRDRYDSLSRKQGGLSQMSTSSSVEAVAPAAALLPVIANDSGRDPCDFQTQFPNSAGLSAAHVTIPARADGAFELEDVAMGVSVQATLEGAENEPAEMAGGYAVYREALGAGTALIRRVLPNGTEDLVNFPQPPQEPAITYTVKLDGNIAGLRNVGNTVEFLDGNGTPRLRVASPYIISADGTWVEAKLTLHGCVVDSNAASPWGRPVTPPGAQSCHVRVEWDNDAVDYPALLDPTWVTTGSMTTARQGHTATLLSTGKVLVAGGANGTTMLASAEVYDIGTGTWAATASMTGVRQWHAAIQLNTSSNPMTSGKVLVAGGYSGSGSLSTAQLYSPSAGTWVAATNLNTPRQQHTATLLPSGKVLVTGGIGGTSTLATAATYDPASGAGTWTATTGAMPQGLKFHQATLVTTTNSQLNGKVLVTGGNNGSGSQSVVYLFDPVQLAFSTLAGMSGKREGHTATVLSNGKILVAGGRNDATTLNTALVFDPSASTGSWVPAGTMTAARQGHTASLLSTGQVLVAGGSNGSTILSSAETYNGLGVWSATNAMPAAVQGQTATLLANNIVLMSGGFDGTSTRSGATLYDVTGGSTCTSNSQCLSGNCVTGVCCDTACTDQCYSCNVPGSVGVCAPKVNGTTCNDNNACTPTDTCQSGVCTGANPTTCTALDQCHLAGTCNPSTGVCSNPNAPDGTACSDGNACTLSDSCHAGTCVPGNPNTCTPSDVCHVVGTCNPSDGMCFNPTAPDGTACDDSNACTAPDQCAAGACQSGAAVSADDGDPCTIDSCDPLSGARHVPDTTSPSCTQWYSGGLKLETLTNSCTSTQVQQSFQITNMGASAVRLSDIVIKLWVNDTSESPVVAQVSAAGCTTTAATHPSCYHPVQGTSAATTQVMPTCGPDATHQVGWEVTLSTADSAQLQPGDAWTNLQAVLGLTSNGSFSPGTSTWYSPCLTGGQYAADNHFAVYYKANLVYSSGISAPDCRAPHAMQRLSGHIAPEMRAAPYVGRVPASTRVRISVGLPHVERAGFAPLAGFVQDLMNPNSPNYRHYITSDDFATRYSALLEDYNDIQTWATSHNLSVDARYSNNLLLGISGTAAALEQALNVNLNYYQRSDGTHFYGPDREPSLDASASVLHISALDNFTAATPLYASNGSYGSEHLYGAKDLRKAYGCPDWDGTDQVLGLFAIDGYSDDNLNADIQLYKDTSNITSNTIIVQCNRADSTDGKCAPARAEHHGCDGSSGELIGDIDMALAMAPGLSHIVVIEDDLNQFAGVLNWVATGDINGKKIGQFSVSYLPAMDKNVAVALMQLAAQGQSVFRGTTDGGALPVPTLADETNDLYITFVGGTQMMLTSTGVSEEVWNEGLRPVSCSSFSHYIGDGCGSWGSFTFPLYQQRMPWNWNDIGGTTLVRNVPDVSAVARDVMMCEQGACKRVGGVSMATPIWAAFIALANQQNAHAGRKPVGFVNPALYAIGNSSAYGTAFNDVPTGSSISTGGVEPTYYTRTGFDIPTGWGSPKCALAAQLASASPAPNKSISAGEFHSCVIRNDDSVSCWGATQYNFGQLGNGSTTGSKTPVQVVNLTGASTAAGSLSAGLEQTCVVMNDGTVRCWGRNNFGMLGNNSTVDSSVPVAVSGLSGAAAVTTGLGHTCAVVGGSVQCWGYNGVGQLGNNSTTGSRIPVAVPDLSQVSAISAGGDFTCALITTGEVKCWGDNGSGQLGNGSTASNSLVPVSVTGISNATAIGIGFDHACAVLANGNVTCWGSNYEGCLGNGSTADSNVPVTVLSDVGMPLTGAKAAASGMEHSCAVMSDGRVTCWGRNAVGQLGIGSSGQVYRPYAKPVMFGSDPLVDAIALAAGYYYNCALLQNGNVACWGTNDQGQLGDGTTTERDSPTLVPFY